MKTMKKILMVLLLTVVAVSMSISAFADTGAFVQSPSANMAPEIVSGDSEDKEDVELVITSYADRGDLPEEAREAIEKAYVKISGIKNLTTLCGALKEVAAKKDIPTTNLEVSDLFDISDAEGGSDGCTYDIVVTAETLENFVGLLHFTDGKWELIDNAVVEEIDGELHLKFSTDGLSPFAIVVDTGADLPVEDTKGNSILTGVLAIVAIAEAAALITILIKFILSKKTA